MSKIDIISGFLGAGKTTLIKKLIAEAYQNEKIVLIENEFGEIGIDGTFLKANAGINNRASRKEIKLLEKTIQTLDFKNQKNSLQKDLKNYFENKIKTSEISKILKKLNNPAKKLLEQSTISKKNKKTYIRFLKRNTDLSFLKN